MSSDCKQDAVFNGDHYLLAAYLCAASMCNLRYTAFCIEHCWKFPNQKLSPSFIRSSLDLLLYQFYFPLFAGGPIINYDNFAQQVFLIYFNQVYLVLSIA